MTAPRRAPEVDAQMQRFHNDTVAEVAAAIDQHAVVVVGMAQNPHVKRARQALKDGPTS